MIFDFHLLSIFFLFSNNQRTRRFRELSINNKNYINRYVKKKYNQVKREHAPIAFCTKTTGGQVINRKKKTDLENGDQSHTAAV